MSCTSNNESIATTSLAPQRRVCGDVCRMQQSTKLRNETVKNQVEKEKTSNNAPKKERVYNDMMQRIISRSIVGPQ